MGSAQQAVGFLSVNGHLIAISPISTAAQTTEKAARFMWCQGNRMVVVKQGIYRSELSVALTFVHRL